MLDPFPAAATAACPPRLSLPSYPVLHRCGPAALVCQRIHTLAKHPSLLRNLELHVYEVGHSGAAADERLAAKVDALCAFLVRHAAAHLRRLVLHLQLCYTAIPGDATCAALKTFCFRLAAHCSAYGALEELSVEGSNAVEPFVAGCFTPLAPTLRRLRHEMADDSEYFGDGSVAPNLAKMTRLQELWWVVVPHAAQCAPLPVQLFQHLLGTRLLTLLHTTFHSPATQVVGADHFVHGAASMQDRGLCAAAGRQHGVPARAHPAAPGRLQPAGPAFLGECSQA